MLTADNITDTQIRDLLSLARHEKWKSTVYVCKIALDDGVTHFRAERIREARARCAEILNARESPGSAP